jgi:hypothetical protein
VSAEPKPNLFIVGAPKCGTTAWVDYLKTHPDIFFPAVKEPHYFCTDLPGMRETATEAEYHALFANAGKARVVGEASVLYLYSTAAAEEIRRYNPDARILIFLREQDDFLVSWHHQCLYAFFENIPDFEKAWRLSGKRPQETIPSSCREPKLLDYAAMGRFAEQVARYLKAFPPEQVRVVRFHEWTANPRGVYLDILGFLGLDDDGRTDFPRINEAKAHRNRLLGRLIANPPAAVRYPVSLLKKLLGRPTLGIASRITKLTAVRGYKTSVNSALREEIRAYYAADNDKLRAMLS